VVVAAAPDAEHGAVRQEHREQEHQEPLRQVHQVQARREPEVDQAERRLEHHRRRQRQRRRQVLRHSIWTTQQ
jgi:hypothetical protein